MARTVRSAKLETRDARLRLERLPGDKPHWQDIHKGLAIGYRPGSAAWIIRVHTGGTKYRHEKIGIADDYAPATGKDIFSFKQIVKLAPAVYDRLRKEAAGEPEPDGSYKVRDAIIDYLAYLEKKPKGSVRDARWRADALIIPLLGDVPVAELKKKQLQDWLRQIASVAPRRRTARGKAQQYQEINPADHEARRRRQATANRTWTTLKAALNLAWRDGKVEHDTAWRSVKAFEDADAARVRWHPIDECQRLINASAGAFRTLVRAALLSGARYGSLATMKVSDFTVHVVRQSDGSTVRKGTLHTIVYKGRGSPKHVTISLTDEGREFFEPLTAGRDPDALMLVKDDGSQWGKAHEHRPIKEASRNARIDPPTNFNVLRHTWASHAVMGGVPLMVVAKNMGHSDTRMVEKHYGHLAPSYVADQVQKYGPRFSAMPEDDKAPQPIRAVVQGRP
jgi:integrase